MELARMAALALRWEQRRRPEQSNSVDHALVDSSPRKSRLSCKEREKQRQRHIRAGRAQGPYSVAWESACAGSRLYGTATGEGNFLHQGVLNSVIYSSATQPMLWEENVIKTRGLDSNAVNFNSGTSVVGSKYCAENGLKFNWYNNG